MRTPKSAKRSACDRCRAKRVRCPRAQDSVDPCARCVHHAVPCVTASAGYPGRPRKTPRLSDRLGPTTAASAIASPELCVTLGDKTDIGLGTPAVEGSMSEDASFGISDTSMTVLEDLGALEFSTSPGHSDPWAHGGETFFHVPLSGETTAQRDDLLGWANTPEIADTDQRAGAMLDVDFLDFPECEANPAPAQRSGAVSSLARFGEKMERRVSAIDSFLADPRNIMEDCPEDSSGLGTENPVAVLLTLTKEFTKIIENLTASANPRAWSSLSDQLLSPSTPSFDPCPSLSTEKVLLVLSSYIKLMRLYDDLFHNVYQSLSQVSAEKIKSIKVKAVFRIGSISSLQDMSGKAYARGIVDVIHSHIRTLERCLGLPMVYCLSGEEVAVSPDAIFADAGRAQLLHTAMTQEDIKSRGGSKSYVAAIRENIKNTVALF